MAEGPDVIGHGPDVASGELGAAQGWHRAWIALRMLDALGDRRRDRGDAAITPEPMPAGEIGADRGSLAVRAMAPAAGAARELAREDALALHDLCLRRAGWRRQRGFLPAGIGMGPFRRLGRVRRAGGENGR